MIKFKRKIFIFLIFIYIVVFILSLFIGRYIIEINNILNLSNPDLQLERNIIYNIRLPRAIVSSLAGISLSLSGLIYQEVFQNDLVSPDLLGVSQGAGVGAAIAIVLGLSNFYITLLSFTVGILTVLLTVLVSNIFNNKNNITLILSGIIVGGFMSSILTIIKYFVNPETQLSTIVYWLMGSFANVTYKNIVFILPIVTILSVFLLFISHRINLIALGKEETETKGVNYIVYRNIIIFIATILTSTTVSFCGTIGWIGLIIPHIVKYIMGRDANKTIPLCIICGAIFTLIADVLSRTLTQSEIPISAITGIFGSIIFTILLFARNNKYSYNLKNQYVSEIRKQILNENIETREESAKCDSQEIIIKLDKVCFKYNNRTNDILHDISLNVYKNDIVLIYGNNGSGKTTLIKLMLGILKPTRGEVYLKNENIGQISLQNRSKIVSYVKQDFFNIHNILVKYYLILGMVNELKFYEKPTEEQIYKVKKCANDFNIEKLLNKKFYEISGGQKQLVAICQAVLQNSKVLILDEPTSSLDNENQKLVINTIIKLSKEYDKTIIFSTHNIDYKNIKGSKVLRLNSYE